MPQSTQNDARMCSQTGSYAPLPSRRQVLTQMAYKCIRHSNHFVLSLGSRDDQRVDLLSPRDTPTSIYPGKWNSNEHWASGLGRCIMWPNCRCWKFRSVFDPQFL